MFTTILPAIIVLVLLSLLSALILSYANKKFKVELDPRVSEILKKLPGANCGGCGYAGCSAFAESSVNGVEGVCPVTDEKTKALIAKILGKDCSSKEKTQARVYCSGATNIAKDNKAYDGIKDCVSAKAFGGSSKACAYACYGFGTCVKICPFYAITIENGLAVINKNKCTGCGLCVDVCPQHLIRLTDIKKPVFIPCSTQNKAVISKKNCDASCIACMKCVKECPSQAISIINSHAVIDYTKCTDCKKCISVCPVKIIREV